MPQLLPTQALPRITQKPGRPTKTELQSREAVLVVMPAQPAPGLWQTLPHGDQLKKLIKDRQINDLTVTTRINNKPNTAITLASLPADPYSPFERLTFAGKLAKTVLEDKPRNLTVLLPGHSHDEGEALGGAITAALLAAEFRLPDYKSKPARRRPLKTITIAGLSRRIDLARAEAEAEGNNLARWLTALPPNELNTQGYISATKELSKLHNWQFQFFDEPKLKKLGAGAFLAVSQGNAARDAGIVKLSYRPQRRKSPDVALVGKGIIFDTGGTNLKPFKAMLDMHHDMAGSAVALGTLLAITRLKLPIAVDCWLAITENRLSNDAYKSRDIVTASNGTTIEVIHTDAEGRMALADTLALAGQAEPAVILDFATLTGTCVSALTERYSGAFANNPALNEVIIAAGASSGERVWPFPLDKDFDEEIASEIADVMQCAAAGGGDHIQAARFLRRFVPESSAWIHVDLSAATRSGGLAHVPTKITGFGVHFAVQLLSAHLDDLRAAATK
jgi:leucyl aminopeptidase